MSEPTTSSVDSVPPEVLALILEIVDIDSLWAFIRSSPRVRSIFHDRRENILSNAIYREVGHTLMPEALAAVNSHRHRVTEEILRKQKELGVHIEKSVSMNWINHEYLPRSDALRWVEKYLPESEKSKWNEKYAEGGRTSEVTLFKTMLLLWELHKDVRFMADLYVRDTLPRFNKFVDQGNLPGSRIPSLADLSFVEKQRLFRCIYRFVISGHLFASSSVKPDYWEADEISQYFLVNFVAWEVEEISCFNDFVIEKIHEKWQEEENNEYNRRAADPELWNLDEPSDPWYPWNVFSRDFKRRFSRKNRSHYAQLPIKDLRALFEAKNEALSQILIKWGHHFEQHIPTSFLLEGLYTEPAQYPIIPGSDVIRLNLHEEGLQWSFQGEDGSMSPNFGWCWSHISCGRELYVQSTSRDLEIGESEVEDSDGSEAFRQLGYVFWDYPRWGGLSQLEPKEIARQIAAEFPQSDFETTDLSMEERIRELASSQYLSQSDVTCDYLCSDDDFPHY